MLFEPKGIQSFDLIVESLFIDVLWRQWLILWNNGVPSLVAFKHHLKTPPVVEFRQVLLCK